MLRLENMVTSVPYCLFHRAVGAKGPELSTTVTERNTFVFFPQFLCLLNNSFTRFSSYKGSQHEDALTQTMDMADFPGDRRDHLLWKKGLPLIHPQCLACSVDRQGDQKKGPNVKDNHLGRNYCQRTMATIGHSPSLPSPSCQGQLKKYNQNAAFLLSLTELHPLLPSGLGNKCYWKD